MNPAYEITEEHPDLGVTATKMSEGWRFFIEEGLGGIKIIRHYFNEGKYPSCNVCYGPDYTNGTKYNLVERLFQELGQTSHDVSDLLHNRLTDYCH